MLKLIKMQTYYKCNINSPCQFVVFVELNYQCSPQKIHINNSYQITIKAHTYNSHTQALTTCLVIVINDQQGLIGVENEFLGL